MTTRRLLIALGLSAGLALPIVALAAGGMHQHGGFGHHGPPATAAEARERAGNMADRLLDRVDATDAQRATIDKILDRDIPQAFALHAEADGVRADLREVLTAPTVDRAALEEVRLSGLEVADSASKIGMRMLGDIASALTADQRKEAGELWDEFHPIGPPDGPGGPGGPPEE